MVRQRTVMKMFRQETVVCKSCLEPIYNSICVDCMSTSVTKWLNINSPKLASIFPSFHQQIVKHFACDNNYEFCIKCRNTINIVFCIYCYAREVFWWLFNYDTQLAKKFALHFNFDFLGTGYVEDWQVRDWKPVEPVIIVDTKKKFDMNFCDDCDQPSEDLVETGGQWLCESCRDA